MSLGATIRARRLDLGLTLQRVADAAGCAKSYLSSIENERRDHPPSEALLARLEGALALRAGELVRIAQWRQTPRPVRRQVERMHEQQRAAQRLAAMLRGEAEEGAGADGSAPDLDSLYRSGALQRLVAQISPEWEGACAGVNGAAGGAHSPGRAASSGAGPLAAMLPLEVPLINSVRAGYPTEFTDLGYPARVADEYVRAPDIHDPDAFAARVVGDSMLPEYREGDVVIFSPARDVTEGADCFARLEPDHETTFKRTYFERGDDGSELIRLQPLNSAYPPRVMRREQVAGLYPAVYVMRRLGGE